MEKIKKWNEGLLDNDSFSAEEKSAMENLRAKISNFELARSGNYPTWDFTKPEIDEFLQLAKAAHSAFGGVIQMFFLLMQIFQDHLQGIRFCEV